jgi:hypothetical protein
VAAEFDTPNRPRIHTLILAATLTVGQKQIEPLEQAIRSFETILAAPSEFPPLAQRIQSQLRDFRLQDLFRGPSWTRARTALQLPTQFVSKKKKEQKRNKRCTLECNFVAERHLLKQRMRVCLFPHNNTSIFHQRITRTERLAFSVNLFQFRLEQTNKKKLPNQCLRSNLVHRINCNVSTIKTSWNDSVVRFELAATLLIQLIDARCISFTNSAQNSRKLRIFLLSN